MACSSSTNDSAQTGPSGGIAGMSASVGGAGSGGGGASASNGPNGGSLSSAGVAASAGNSSSAGAVSIGGGGGSAGAGGAPVSTAGPGPCDIYQTANTPCVAAHSTVRALYSTYAGPLYQVQRVADNGVKDVLPITPGGYADTSAQVAFCAQTNCTISVIYDQSPQHNDLPVSPKSTFLPTGGTPALADAAKITIGGKHTVYGVSVSGGVGTAYRNNETTGVAKGNEAEAMYMVIDGTRFSGTCCFDYGNAEADGADDGNGTMEAIYFGSDSYWGGKGQGAGPWIAGDLENGMFKCDQGFPQTSLDLSTACPTAAAQTITSKFATAMLKGPADNTFTLKSGDAQSGKLMVQWNGARPMSGYSPKKLQGAIILGTGGDGSNGGTGTFFEGAMIAGTPGDSVDDLIQANIVAAGYGK